MASLGPAAPLRPNPVLKKAVAGFWGLTAVSVEVDLPMYTATPALLRCRLGPLQPQQEASGRVNCIQEPSLDGVRRE